MEDEPEKVYTDDRHGQHKEMLYGYDKDGNFTKQVGYHGTSERVILQQVWDEFKDRIEAARQKVLSGESSPILYYMEKNLLNAQDLATHTGICIWFVKLHLKPGAFQRLSEKKLKRYAEAFNITIDQLKKVE